jgi:hypothetical protein
MNHSWQRRRAIAWYECVLVVRDATMWLSIAALVVAIVAAWMSGSGWLDTQRALIETLAREERVRLADLQRLVDREVEKAQVAGQASALVPFNVRHATYAGHYMGQRWMVLPILQAAALALGESDLQPGTALASLDRWQGQDRGEFASPAWLRLPRFDLFFATAYLLPLALILTCTAAVSAEREHRTLHLRLTQGTRPWTLGIGRVLMRGGLVTASGGAAVAVLMLMRGGADGDTLARLAVWEVSLAAYAACWLAVIAWIDAGGRSIAANLLMASGAWILLLFVLPGAVTTFAELRHPVNSRAELERTRREAYQETWNGRNEEILRAFYAAHPEIPPDRDPRGSLERYAVFQMRALELIREEVRPIETTLDTRARAYRESLHASRYASPLLLFYDLSTTAAGTDEARREDFRAQRERFLAEWDDFYATRIYQRIAVDDLSRTPAFRYQETGLKARAGNIAASLAALFGLTAIMLTAAFQRYRHFPV